MNLRCPTLSEFRWYKDVFMTKVLTRNDCNANFWKEKFISGLPVLFAERVKNRLKSKSTTNSIDWSILTYGDLSAEIHFKRDLISTTKFFKRDLISTTKLHFKD